MTHFWKRFLGVGLAATMAVSLGACQAGGKNNTEAESSAAATASQEASTAESSATEETAAAMTSNPQECIENFDENTDYFPEKIEFSDATGVSVEYFNSYKVITVKQPTPGAAPVSYVLVQCGAPKPKLEGELADAMQIEVPVNRIASASTTQIPALQLLEVAEKVVGVANAGNLHDGPVKQQVAAGTTQTFGNEDYTHDVEKVVALNVDVMFQGGTENESDAKLRELGVPLVALAEWLETTPLGRAEWMKYFSLFVNKEAKATELFTKIRADYQAVADKLKDVENRPTVIAGTMYKGTWYIPAGDSYFAAYLKDAGADYVFADTEGTGSIEDTIETVLAKGADADFWVNGDSRGKWPTKADVLQADERFANFAAVEKGNMWNPTLRINEEGGNDYWQLGVVRPDLVLGDLAAAFHPELMPDHEFTFYQQVK